MTSLYVLATQFASEVSKFIASLLPDVESGIFLIPGLDIISENPK